MVNLGLNLVAAKLLSVNLIQKNRALFQNDVLNWLQTFPVHEATKHHSWLSCLKDSPLFPSPPNSG